jgi:hypothetical protein
VPTLDGLSPACSEPGTETAQRFLAGAYDSVEAVLDSLSKVREVRRQELGDLRGRLPDNEQDLLRAAIVFAGAGLDASLKRLIRDTLPPLLERSEQAHSKFETFAAEKLGTGDIVDARVLARYLTSPNPRDRLIEDYVYDLTASNRMSDEEVQRTAGALGIDDKDIRKWIGRLRTLFVARNEISHELDLQRPERRGDRARRTRAMAHSVALCHEGLEVGQLIINGVGALLHD